MNHRLATILISLGIIAAIVGGVVSWEWKQITPKQTKITATSSPTGASTTPGSSTTSALVLPVPVLGPQPLEAADGTASATPSMIAVNEPTNVVITIPITDTRVIAGSVNLQRLDANGKVIAALGILNDSGTNGDAVAGDGVYSISKNLMQSTASSIRLKVSWALVGMLKRATSNVIEVQAGQRFSGPNNRYSLILLPGLASASQQDPGHVVFAKPGADGYVLHVYVRGNPARLGLSQWIASVWFGSPGTLNVENYVAQYVSSFGADAAIARAETIGGREAMNIEQSDEGGLSILEFINAANSGLVFVVEVYGADATQGGNLPDQASIIEDMIHTLALVE